MLLAILVDQATDSAPGRVVNTGDTTGTNRYELLGGAARCQPIDIANSDAKANLPKVS